MKKYLFILTFLAAILFAFSAQALTISNVLVNTTASSASLTWTTSEPTSSYVEYTRSDVEPISYTNYVQDANLITNHQMTLSNLSTGKYYYRIWAFTSGIYVSTTYLGNFTISADMTGTGVIADVTPPVISSVQVSSSSITADSATISWLTDEPSTSGVNYGIASVSEFTKPEDASLVTSHIATLTGLRAATVYQYKVFSRDSAGNIAYSAIYNFTTASSGAILTGDTTPPTVSSFLAESTAGGFAKITVTFSESVDQATLNSANIYFSPVGSTAKVAGNLTLSASSVVFTATECLQNMSYAFIISRFVKDLTGNQMSADYTSGSQNLYSSVCQTTTATPTTTPTITTTTIQSGQLQGKVTDSNNATVSGAYIYVHNNDFTLYFWSQSDSAGNYTITNITPGSYTLELSPPSNFPNLLRPSTLTVSIVSGVTSTQNVQFSAGGKTIKGKVISVIGTPITDAQVEAYQESTSSWTTAFTDTYGNFILKVSGGSWSVGVMPKTGIQASWVYAKSPSLISFSNDAIAEEKTVDFQVDSTPSSIFGKIILPSGAYPKSGTSVTAISSSGLSGFSSTGIDGSFSINLSPGTYNLEIYSADSSYAAPSISAFTLLESEKKNLETIYLVLKTEHIKGFVYNSQKQIQSNILVSAKQIDGTGFVLVYTNSSGAYDLSISSGSWEVIALGIASPTQVQVIQGATVNLDFVLPLLDAVLFGTVKDSAGNILSDISGFAILEPDFIGSPVERGTFKISAKAGSYTLRLDLSAGSIYNSTEKISVLLVGGQTKEAIITLFKNNAVISGFLKDTAGVVMTGIKAEVFAYSDNGSFQKTLIDSATGGYKFNVGSGVWYLGLSIDSVSGYQAKSIAPGGLKIVGAETVSQDIFITRVDSLISGSVKKSDGSPLANAWVGVSSRPIVSGTDFAASGFLTQEIETGVFSDKDGNFSIKVPGGTYYARAFYALAKGLINPDEIKVVAASNKPATVELIFKSSLSSVSGAVFYNDLPQTGAFVFAWSEKGGQAENMTDKNGNYILRVSNNDIWHLGARMEKGSDILNSDYLIINIGAEEKNSINFFLKKAGEIPKPILASVDAIRPQVMILNDQAKVALPANATATAGQVNVRVSPAVQLPDQARAAVIGKAYDVDIKDAKGISIVSFNAPISITLPYNKKEIEKLGISEDDIKPSFFDEASGIWKKVDKFVIDKTNSQVIIETFHLTRFALIASPADINPPEAPTKIDVAKIGPGALFISWINPLKDFDHIKIYRSTKLNELGRVAFNDIKRTFETDTKLADGLTYYYTVRSVDLAGNESINIEQISGSPLPGEEKVKSTFLKNLRQGMKGEDVKNLQKILFEEGVYPDNIISGYFGSLTKKAVINFQKKYGLSPSLGFVGSLTRAKLNELYGQ
ncbi:MAG: carboxypeptidase regulatory-like domain-containing protein [Parcubacteria group bacterium]|nr:carboxypeptidase regulatory-like domain-containing protein [Parcubacteria group bacterium]